MMKPLRLGANRKAVRGMGLSKLASALNALAPHDDVHDLASSVEAIRLHWNRASQRIVQDAKDRVARERPTSPRFRD